jgi:hypothetical protein
MIGGRCRQAVPVTFGLVAVGWMTGLDEAREDPARAGGHPARRPPGGAAGTLAVLGEAGPGGRATGGAVGQAAPPLPGHTNRLRLVRSRRRAGAAGDRKAGSGRHAAGPVRRRSARAARAGVLGHAAQAQPGRGHPHPGLQYGSSACWRPRRGRRQGTSGPPGPGAEGDPADLLSRPGRPPPDRRPAGLLRVDARRMQANLDAARLPGWPSRSPRCSRRPWGRPRRGRSRASASAALARQPLADALTAYVRPATPSAAGITNAQLRDPRPPPTSAPRLYPPRPRSPPTRPPLSLSHPPR